MTEFQKKLNRIKGKIKNLDDKINYSRNLKNLPILKDMDYLFEISKN